MNTKSRNPILVVVVGMVLVLMAGCKALSGDEDYVPSPGGGHREGPKIAPGQKPTPGGPSAALPPGPPQPK